MNNRKKSRPLTRRLFRDRLNPLDFMTDGQIIKNYRLDRASIYDLYEEMQDDLKKSTHRSSSLSVSLQVMIVLRYYASGSYMNVIGDAHGVSEMAVSRCVNAVSKNITGNIQRYLKFPVSNVNKQNIMYDFYDINEFPLVLGAIDGTLIRIKAPSVDEHLYVYRKGYHALNIQGVCNSNNRFTNVVARWPGPTHDSYIWND
ncbi:HARBI1 [Mytilus coruscus]|uniref:Putative nuclease HARBI1 n=1 Tax=Mytilus coruscus TaxID=42192 RepID=A0A6J8AQ43_MYTCO|nr:HARBI1 [Mytilus coruscus]